ncbi:MAG: hypothetical protein ACYC3I_00805 [Gemmataceae bacterium]
MIFADLATGDSVFVDANTLIYHFGPHPAFGTVCRQLVQRIENPIPFNEGLWRPGFLT